ncbi:CYTH domain-containing protein [Marinifilum flexuosum]|uniref:Adenylate cyclase n=1 Tax=Marinifilum flexuosum TaxID=1117708 RepID=A0A419WNA6_9BACT|nr:CYTH domain-containing protein [Marinifilum flexuosum]RKD96884.1 adenylate cyclase [Marinifilum flexuosum]
MAIEIERKFLVNQDLLPLPNDGKKLIQGYIWSDPQKSLRIRIAGEKAFLTIKSGNDILKRSEFEYEIPMTDAHELLELCDAKIEKTRYLIPMAQYTWEVDVFHGDNQGLIVAEIELASSEEQIKLPEWIDQEVSNDPKYLNVSLIENPFIKW